MELEYEAYYEMALKVLRTICEEACNKWKLLAIAVDHRVGVVPVGEASVIIAASSAHRLDAIQGMHYCIDELKRRVPIFKKEVYEDGSVWKANCEGCTLKHAHAHR